MSSGFVPQEDQGAFMVDIQLPQGASMERTQQVLREVGAIVSETPGVENYLSVVGYSMLKQGVASKRRDGDNCA